METQPISGPHICEYCNCQCTCNKIPCSCCQEYDKCPICDEVTGHTNDCPYDDSPFGNLIREGFD